MTHHQQFEPAASAFSKSSAAWLRWTTSFDLVLARPMIWASLVAMFLWLQSALILTHRPWLDEWQAVLIATQSPDWATLLTQLRYEGHPPLWYLMLRFLAWLTGGPEQALMLANLFYAAVGALIILRYAPLSRLDRLLLLTSEIMLIEYFGISRSLGLGVVLFLWALASWRSRWVWLPIALLPLSDFLFGLLSIALLLLRWRERANPQTGISPAGILFWLVCSLAAAYSVRPHPDIVSDPPYAPLIAIGMYIQQLGMNVLPWQMLEGEPAWNGVPPYGIGLILAPVFLYICYIATRRDRLHAALIFGFILILGLFVLKVYPLYFRHTSLTALLLVGLIWLQTEKTGILPVPIIRLWLSLLCFVGLVVAGFMLSRPFDGGRDAVKLIYAEKLTDKPWFAYPAYRAITLSGEGRMSIGDLEQGCSSTFRRWSFRSRIEDKTQLIALVRQRARNSGSFYLMTSVDLPEERGLLRRIATVPYGYNHLKYYLWAVNGGPTVHDSPPACVPGLRSL